MQRGMINFPYPTGRQPVGAGVAPPGQTTLQGNGTMKASIILFDTTPGTRSFVVPPGVFKIRVFVAGGAGYVTSKGGSGGGYSEKIFNVTPGQIFSYTVGVGGTLSVPNGGTSSFGGLISATGSAADGGAAGVGSGGDINSAGGAGQTTVGSGASCGHRFGDGTTGSSGATNGGAGWVSQGTTAAGGSAGVDGFGLGIVPGSGGASGVPGGYGAGGGPNAPGGLGAGAGSGTIQFAAGGGMTGGSGQLGGRGGVGVEALG